MRKVFCLYSITHGTRTQRVKRNFVLYKTLCEVFQFFFFTTYVKGVDLYMVYIRKNILYIDFPFRQIRFQLH